MLTKGTELPELIGDVTVLEIDVEVEEANEVSLPVPDRLVTLPV